MIAAAYTFHPRPDIDIATGIEMHVSDSLDLDKNEQDYLAKRTTWIADNGVTGVPDDLTVEERLFAYHLKNRDAGAFARALAPVTGPRVANYIFGFGVVG